MDDSEPFSFDPGSVADSVDNTANYVVSSDAAIAAGDQSAAETSRLYTAANPTSANDTTMVGDGNSPPVVSTTTNSGLATTSMLLGNAGSIASSLGMAVGNIQKQLASVVPNFKAGQSAAANGNPISIWLANASTTDKLLVGISLATIVWMIMEGN